MNQFKKLNGINIGIFRSLLNISQVFILVVWAGIIQRFIFKLEDHPEMLTGGFFWFNDLTISDPYFILPLVNSLLIFFNFLYNTTTIPNTYFVKSRRQMMIMPFLSLPMFCTLPTGLVLYTFTSSLCQFLLLKGFHNSYIRQYTGELEFYANSKLSKVVLF